MDVKIVVAVISASAALVVAIISLARAVIAGKQASTSAEKLELLRQALQEKASAGKLRQDQLRLTVEAIAKAINSIQRMKNEVQLIVESVPGSLDPQPVQDSIIKAREELWEEFQEQAGNLSDSSERPFHRAKTAALKIEQHITSIVTNCEGTFALSNAQRDQLLLLRSALTEYQHELRDARQDLLTQQVLEYGT